MVLSPARRLLAAALVVAPALAVAAPVAAGVEPVGCAPAPTDQVGPEVHEAELGVTAIDVSSGPVEVPVRARVTDVGGSGVRSVNLSVGYPDSGFSRWSPGRESAVVILSPDGDDWWSGTFVVGQWDGYFSPWVVSQVWAWDAAGNYGQHSFYDYLLPPGAPATAPSLTIAPHGIDRERPYLVDLVVDRTTVDVRRRSRRIAVSARVSDGGGAGVSSVSVVGGQQLHLASGTGADGWWQGSLVVPRWTANGDHPLRVVMHDAAYNDTWTDPRRLKARGLPWRYRARSVTDDRAPRFVATRIRPLATDVSTSDGRLVVAVRLADPLSGVRTATARLLRPRDGSMLGEAATPLHLARGTRRDGWWRGSIPLHGCGDDPGGRYRVTFDLTDRIGNSVQRLFGPEIRIRNRPH